MNVRTLVAIGLSSLCTACGGPVLEEKPISGINPHGFDGGFISYFFRAGS